MDKKMTTALVAAVVIVAGMAVAVTALSKDDSGNGFSEAATSGCNLWIYGNVNGDNYIDQKDTELLRKILDGEDYEVYVTVYDGYNASNNISRISFADANQDGVLDEKDIAYIEKIIAYENAYSKAVSEGKLSEFNDEITLYYNNCDNNTCTVHLPIKSLISMYFSNSEVVRLLGATDRVVATDSTTINKPTLLPEFQGMTNLGDRKAVNSEAVLATGADAYFTGSSSTYSAYLEQNCGSQMDIIRLSAWEDNNVMAGTLTLGYMLGCTEKAYEYIDWCNKYINEISERLSGISGNVTTIVPKGRNNCLEGNGLGSGQYEITELAGAINLASGLSATSEYPNFTQEWALTKNPQFIVISGYCGFEKGSAENVKTYVTDIVEKTYEIYKGTSAVTNNKVYFIANEIFTGPSDIVSMVYCAEWFYPDVFGDFDGTAVFQEYIDKFCPSLAEYDLSAHLGQFIWTPENA